MKGLQQFNYENKTAVRGKEINGEPWLVAKDVCDALDYKDHKSALRKLDDDEKLGGKFCSSGQNREMQMVNQSGLYHLIFRSNKPEAKKFRRWVTQEVLPAVMSTGEYKVEENAKGGSYMLPIPKPLDVYGMTVFRYDYWLLRNGYSVSSGCYHRRIQRHPEHFYKHSNGKWYISEAYGKAILNYRGLANKITRVKALPRVTQLGILITNKTRL